MRRSGYLGQSVQDLIDSAVPQRTTPLTATSSTDTCGGVSMPLFGKDQQVICCSGRWITLPAMSQMGCPQIATKAKDAYAQCRARTDNDGVSYFVDPCLQFKSKPADGSPCDYWDPNCRPPCMQDTPTTGILKNGICTSKYAVSSRVQTTNLQKYLIPASRVQTTNLQKYLIPGGLALGLLIVILLLRK